MRFNPFIWIVIIAVSLVRVTGAKAEEHALIAAYKKEFAFLEAEKSALKERLS